MTNKDVVACCHSCGLMVKFSGTKANTVFSCPRCLTLICKNHAHTARNCFILAITALLLFIPAITFPVLKLAFRTMKNDSSIVDTVAVLYEQGFYFLGILLSFTTLILPMLYMLLLIYFTFSLVIKKKLPLTSQVLTLFCKIREWVMVDIFMISVLVSIVKLVGMFDLLFGTGFYLLISITLIMGLIEFYFDRHHFWAMWSANE